MTDPQSIESHELNTFQFNQAMKKSLAHKLGLEGPYSGGHTNRNEKGWRDNEIEVDYIWITKISRSFNGVGGLISLKFIENEFQGIKNPEKLIQGIFLCDAKANLRQLYFEEQTKEINDPVWKINDLELFTANNGITLDGVSYEYHVIARNIETQIFVNNPNGKQWKKWENEILGLGKRLAENSSNEELKQLFE